MTFAHLNQDVKIYYELSGQGIPVVFISGYRGDHTAWEFVQNKVSSNFQTLVFDNLGIGQTTDKGGPLSLEKMADVTMELIDRLQLKTPHIVGQSMGGAIAQFIAKKYPNKISKLVLINTVSKFNTVTLLAIESFVKLRQEDVSFECLFSMGLPWSFSSKYLEDSSCVEAYRARLINNQYPQSLEDQRRLLNALKEFNSEKWIHEIQKATLVISSKDDIMTRPEELQNLAQAIKGSQFVMIPGGHASVFECPDDIGQALSSFLKDK